MILSGISLFSAEKNVTEKILIFNFENGKAAPLISVTLTEIFMKELGRNFNYEFHKDSVSPNEKEALDIGEKKNFNKVIKGKLSFFNNNWYLEITCFSVKKREILVREIIYTENFENLISKVKEVGKLFFIEKKDEKKEKITIKKGRNLSFNYNTYKYGKIGTGLIIAGNSTYSIFQTLFIFGIYGTVKNWSSGNVIYGAILGSLSCYLSVFSLLVFIGGIIMGALGTYLLYEYKRWLLYAKLQNIIDYEKTPRAAEYKMEFGFKIRF